MNFAALKLSLILLGLSWLLKFQAWRHPKYRARIKEKNLVAQFVARDEEIGRWFKFEDGRITSGGGVRGDADVTVGFKNAAVGASLLMPPINWLDQVNAQKEFSLTVQGDTVAGACGRLAQPASTSSSTAANARAMIRPARPAGTPRPRGSARPCRS